ncbi:MAG: FAD-dependent oxidoreductase, partial [Bacillota bacterium]|nr:FAD-dependent oxidoreductase [Bacillota bacterium]
LGSQVTRIEDGLVHFKDSETDKSLPAARVLLSVGRRPVTRDIGLENLGVYTERGRIVTDRQGLTNVPNVYAAGDVNGVWMLAHAAYREAEVVVNTILGQTDTMRYQAMPSVIYTNPEVAFAGETEETCREKLLAFHKVVLPMNFSGRYMAENEGGTGLIKLLVDPDRERILGCHLLGNYASEIILAAGFMIETEMKIKDIKELVFPHPTVGEIIREAIFHS